MLAIFRTNQLQLGIVLIVYAFVLYAYGFYYPVKWAPEHPGIWVRWVYSLVGDPSGNLAKGMAIGMVFLTGFLLNFTVARHRLADEVNLFPGLFFVLFSSLTPGFQQLSALHFANLFLLLALGELLKIYRSPDCSVNLLNAGIWIGAASLCYSTYLLFLLCGIAALFTLRAINFKELLALLIGGFLPLAWVAVYGYFTDSLGFILEKWGEDWGFVFNNLASGQPETRIVFILSILMILTFLLSMRRYLLKTVFEVQKKINLLYWLLLSTIFTILFQGSAGPQHFLVLALPAGIFLSFSFNSFSKQTAEVLHLLIFVGVITLQVIFGP